MTDAQDLPDTVLAACPFCGGEAVKLHHAQSGAAIRIICGVAACATGQIYWAPEAEAIAAWNRRSLRAERDAVLMRKALEEIKERSRSWAGAAWAYNRAGHIANEALAALEQEGDDDTRG